MKSKKRDEPDEATAKMSDWRAERGAWEIVVVIAMRQSGSAWRMELKEKVKACEILNDRALARARLLENDNFRKRARRSTAAPEKRCAVLIEDVDDSQLIAIAGAVIGRGGLVRESDIKTHYAVAEKIHPEVIKRGILARLGDGPFEQVIVFLRKDELGSLFRTDRSTCEAAKAAVSCLTLESSAFYIITHKLTATWRLRELDVTAYAIFSNQEDILNLSHRCPNLSSLTLRQVYTSPRPKDRTTVFELNGITRPQQTWHQHIAGRIRILNDPRTAFARSAFAMLLHAFRYSLTRLRLYLDGDDWLQDYEFRSSRAENNDETPQNVSSFENGTITSHGFSTLDAAMRPYAPRILKELTIGSVVRKAAHANGRTPTKNTCTHIRDADLLTFLSRTEALQALTVESEVRVEASFFEQCAQRHPTLQYVQVPRLGTSVENKWSSAMASSRARSLFSAHERLLPRAQSVRMMAAEALAETAALRTFYTQAKNLKRLTSTLKYVTKLQNTSPMPYYASQQFADEDRNFIRSARTEIRRAIDHSVSVLSNAEGLEHFNLLLDEQGANPWGDQSEDIGWPDLEAELGPALGPKLISISLDGGQYRSSDYSRPLGPYRLGDWLASSPSYLIFEPRFLKLRRVHLENIAFYNSELCIQSPPTLRAITLRSIYRLRALRFYQLPHLRHITLDDPRSNNNYICSPSSSHHLRVLSVNECPNLISLVVDIDLFGSGFSSDGILLRGAMPHLSSLCLFSTKKTNGRSVDSPAAILADVLKLIFDKFTRTYDMTPVVISSPIICHDDDHNSKAAAPHAYVSNDSVPDELLPQYYKTVTNATTTPTEASSTFDLSSALNTFSPGWSARLQAAAGQPEQLSAWLKEIECEKKFEESFGTRRARDGLMEILKEQRQQLRDSGCCLSLDCELRRLVTARFENVQVPVVGAGHLSFNQDRIIELILNQLDTATATRFFRELAVQRPSKLRRLELCNFAVEDTSPLVLPASLYDLSLNPVQGTRSLQLDATACGGHLQRLCLGGPSLTNVVFTSAPYDDTDLIDDQALETTTLPNCREFVLRAERMKSEALHALIRILPNLNTMRLIKCRALDPEVTLTLRAAVKIVLDGCTHVTSLNIQGERLAELELIRLGKLTSLALFAPYLISLDVAHCKVLDDRFLDPHTSSTFDCLAKVHINNCKLVTVNFFAPFATARNRSNLQLSMRNCDATYKPKGATTKGVIDVCKTDAWLNMSGHWGANSVQSSV